MVVSLLIAAFYHSLSWLELLVCHNSCCCCCLKNIIIVIVITVIIIIIIIKINKEDKWWAIASAFYMRLYAHESLCDMVVCVCLCEEAMWSPVLLLQNVCLQSRRHLSTPSTSSDVRPSRIQFPLCSLATSLCEMLQQQQQQQQRVKYPTTSVLKCS